MSVPTPPTEVRWLDGRGFAVYHGAGLRLTAPPPGFDGAVALDYVPGAVATVCFEGEEQRDMTPDEREALSRRLISMHCGAWDAWNEDGITLAVVFKSGVVL